jgi:hypothetical protein
VLAVNKLPALTADEMREVDRTINPVFRDAPSDTQIHAKTRHMLTVADRASSFEKPRRVVDGRAPFAGQGRDPRLLSIREEHAETRTRGHTELHSGTNANQPGSTIRADYSGRSGKPERQRRTRIHA